MKRGTSLPNTCCAHFTELTSELWRTKTLPPKQRSHGNYLSRATQETFHPDIVTVLLFLFLKGNCFVRSLWYIEKQRPLIVSRFARCCAVKKIKKERNNESRRQLPSGQRVRWKIRTKPPLNTKRTASKPRPEEEIKKQGRNHYSLRSIITTA